MYSISDRTREQHDKIILGVLELHASHLKITQKRKYHLFCLVKN